MHIYDTGWLVLLFKCNGINLFHVVLVLALPAGFVEGLISKWTTNMNLQLKLPRGLYTIYHNILITTHWIMKVDLHTSCFSYAFDFHIYFLVVVLLPIPAASCCFMFHLYTINRRLKNLCDYKITTGVYVWMSFT